MGGPRRRSKKPSPCLVFIPVIERNQGRRCELCPEVSPSAMPKPRCVRTMQTTRVVAFSGKGNGLSGTRLRPLAHESFPRKWLCLVYLQARGEVAERLKAAVC